MIGDFGVPIALLLMVTVDFSINGVYTQVRKTIVLRDINVKSGNVCLYTVQYSLNTPTAIVDSFRNKHVMFRLINGK